MWIYIYIYIYVCIHTTIHMYKCRSHWVPSFHIHHHFEVILVWCIGVRLWGTPRGAPGPSLAPRGAMSLPPISWGASTWGARTRTSDTGTSHPTTSRALGDFWNRGPAFKRGHDRHCLGRNWQIRSHCCCWLSQGPAHRGLGLLRNLWPRLNSCLGLSIVHGWELPQASMYWHICVCKFQFWIVFRFCQM